MKIVSLNTWSGSQGDIFFNFIQEQAADTDVFCLQELYTAWPGAPETMRGERMFLLDELAELLPDFVPFFSAKSHGSYENEPVDWPVNRGQAMFVKNSQRLLSFAAYEITNTSHIPGAVVSEGEVVAQVARLQSGSRECCVINFHGLSRPGTKLDTPDRLLQSQRLLHVIDSFAGKPLVLTGDFNLMPNTDSIGLISSRLRNLITEFAVSNTRNEITWKKYPAPKQHFADYTFVSKNIEVRSFEVPYNIVSDHLPMILRFEPV